MLDLTAFNQDRDLEKRQLEKEGIRYLLNQLFGSKQVRLDYTPHNKPFLAEEDLHISISHSHDKLAIIVNTKESTGIDIELIRDKVRNIQHKFLNNEELRFAANDTQKLTVLWAAKEAIYKTYGLKELGFRENISIEGFEDREHSFVGKIDLPHLKKKYLLSKQIIDDYVLVFTVNEI